MMPASQARTDVGRQITQAQIKRAIRAARDEGCDLVEVRDRVVTIVLKEGDETSRPDATANPADLVEE